MVRQIEWSAEAIEDLAGIKDYLLEQTPGNAEAIIRQIEMAGERLIDFPYANRVVPEWADPERRETFVHRWRLMYRVLPDQVLPDQVRIVGVIHGSRMLEYIDGRSFQDAPQQEYVAS